MGTVCICTCLIGVCSQAVVFKVDYVVEVAGNKEFGSVFLQRGQQQENIALSIVQNGWAKVCMHQHQNIVLHYQPMCP